MATYTVDIRPRARRSLSQLDPTIRKAIAETIDALSTSPRPPGAVEPADHNGQMVTWLDHVTDEEYRSASN